MLQGSLDDGRGAIVQSIAKEFEINNLKIRDIVDHFVKQISMILRYSPSNRI
jgi:hypothetical protein